ncbi:MAG: YqjF family protein [Luteolibacter sp.]
MIPSPAQRLAACQRPPGFPVMRQRWAGLLFLHWAVDPALIAGRLPLGLSVDTFDGKAWLGVVPFYMERVRPVGLPPVPLLSWFHELNVRTYVHDAEGNPGVWFFSLDCNQPVAVEIARRGFHLPYEHAAMTSVKSGNRIQYTSRRKSPDARDADYDYETPVVTQAAAPGTLEWFLAERYLLFSSNPSGDLFCGRVHHTPYQIAPAVCTRWSTEPLRLDGFPEPTEAPPSMLVAAPVDVAIFPLRHCVRSFAKSI